VRYGPIMNARTDALISIWSGPFLSRHRVSKLRSLRSQFRKAVGKVYALGILAYFAAAGVQSIFIPAFSDWLSYISRHAVYAFAWPIIVPIEISSERGPSSPQQWIALLPAEFSGRECDFAWSRAERHVVRRSVRRERLIGASIAE